MKRVKLRKTECVRRPAVSLVAAVMFASGALTFSGCTRVAHTDSTAGASENITVAVARVSRQNLSRDLEIAAEFRPFQEIDLYAKVAGYVKTIRVDYGDRVSSGQVLADLEVPELQDELQRLVAATKQAEQDVTTAQAELRQSQSAEEVTHLQYTRLSAVMKTRPGLIAQQDVDFAQGKDREAEAKVAADQSSFAAAQQRLEVARANERKTRTLIAYTHITAPFSGVITKRYADTGALIQQGTASHTQAMPLVRLAQTDVLRLVIPVPEADVLFVRLGEPVDVTIPSMNRTFPGHVARFSDQLDLQTRTMHTEVDVPNPKLLLIPGMYATARLALTEHSDALTLPVQAVNHEKGKNTVLRVDRGAIEECDIELGIENPDRVEILSGLHENDLVVIGDRSALKSGEKVTPKLIAENSPNGRS